MNPDNVWCFHHTDADGHCAGAIVKYFVPHAKTVEINYGYKPEIIFDVVNPGDTVFVVDFSFTPEDMQKLVHEMKCRVIWIDHHKTAIESLHEYKDIEGIRDEKFAGCELAWDYFNNDRNHRPTPEIVKFVGRYDVWDHSDIRVVPFNYGLTLLDTVPSSAEAMDFWATAFEQDPIEVPTDGSMISAKWGPVDQVLNMGNIAMAYKDARCEYIMKNSFEYELEGLKLICINQNVEDTYSFASVRKPEHDAAVWFYFTGKKWKWSIRSLKDGIDVTPVARKFGGGGHAGACGFTAAEFSDFFKV